MEGLVILGVIIFIVLPIATFFSISGMNARMSELQRSVAELKSLLLERETRPVAWEERSGVAETPSAPAPVEPPPLDAPLIDANLLISQVQGEKKSAAEQIVEPQEVEASPATPPPFPGEGYAAVPAGMPDFEDDLYEDEIDEADVPDFVPKASWIAARFGRARAWLLSEGNIWVTGGVVLFLAGFGLLFSYVAQRNLLSVEMRLAGAAVVGIAMTGFGWRMRAARRTYALILQGGGIGVLYVVLLAGAKLGGVIPAPASVVGMLILSAFTVLLAIMQDFELLACFALLGGFAAPILVSTGSSNFVALFSIYSLLNIEILCITLWRDWRKARWGGLLASVAVGALWGILRWDASFFPSVEPFLILFFATYSAVTLVPALSGLTLPGKLAKIVKNRGRVDLPMIATLPFAFLFLQIPAAYHTGYGVALACLAVGSWYMLLGRCAMQNDAFRKAGYSPNLFLAYCIVFSNLAIPFIFKQSASSAIWAVEGAVLTAVAAKRRDDGTLACGVLLHAFALALYVLNPRWTADVFGFAAPSDSVARLMDPNGAFLASSFIFAASALASAYFCHVFAASRAPERIAPLTIWKFQVVPNPRCLNPLFAGYGTIWFALFAYHVTRVRFPDSPVTLFALLFAAGAAGFFASVRLRWRAAAYVAVPAVGALAISLVSHTLISLAGMLVPYFFRTAVWLSLLYGAWSKFFVTVPLAFAMFAAGFMTFRGHGETPSRARRGLWLLLVLTGVYYASGAMSRLAGMLPVGWRTVGLAEFSAFLPVALAVAIATLDSVRERLRVPARCMRVFRAETLYALLALMALHLPFFVLGLSTHLEPGSLYVPVLHPLELWQLGYMAAVGLLIFSFGGDRAKRIGLRYALPVAGFLWMNCVAARIAFVYFGEFVRLGSFADAPHFQGIIAILWGLSALALIFGAKKFSGRLPWFMGSALLGADILKLMLIDMRNSATVIRIFAFLLLGGLFLLIGWIAPLPPKKEERSAVRVEKKGDEEYDEDEYEED